MPDSLVAELPPAEAAAQVEEEIRLLEQKRHGVLTGIEKYEKDHAGEFFKPFRHQAKALSLLHKGKKIVVLQGANRVGKTVFGANVCGSFAIGKELWSGKTSVFGGRPTRGRILASDWEHHAAEVIIPELKKWIPPETYTTKKNNVGVEYFWTFKNGSTIELITHKQDTREQEGWTGDWVWADEPCSREKYVANRRGIVTTDGVFILTMTSVYESWILDDIILSPDKTVGCVTHVPMKANTLLSVEAIRSFRAALAGREEEITPRIDGGFLQLSGRVLKEFNKDKHVIAPFEIQHDWLVTAMIDLHLSKPQAVSFYAVDPHNIYYAIDEVWENMPGETIADIIVKKKAEKHWRLTQAFIDPLSKGDDNYFKNRGGAETSFAIIDKSLARNRIRLQVASKDKDSGVRNLKSRLKGPNGLPCLYFFDTCKRHIHEIMRWVMDDNGHPSKEGDDHFMENLYRYTLTGAKYKPIEPDITNIRKKNYAYA